MEIYAFSASLLLVMLGVCDHLRVSSIILSFEAMQKTIGLLLIVIGAIMLIWDGFSYTRREKIVDAGPIHISADRKESLNWPPYAGGILVVAGAIVVVMAKKSDK